jgi:tRNA(His) guanylyltransferase
MELSSSKMSVSSGAMSMEALGDYIKTLEIDLPKIPTTNAFMIRLDGHCFGRYTVGFELPFDEGFRIAMIRTACDLLIYFHPVTAYTHSDEITLIFSAQNPDMGAEHQFSGRVLKMVSLCAGYASSRFNYHACQLVHEGDIVRCDGHKYTYTMDTIEKVRRQEAMFDGRIVIVKEMMDICRHQVFRRKDCYRNAIAAYCTSIGKISKKSLNALDNQTRKAKLKEVGFDFDKQVPFYLRYGVYIKKEKYLKPLEEGKTAERSRVAVKTLCAKLSEDYLAIFLAKVWPAKSTVEISVLSIIL